MRTRVVFENLTARQEAYREVCKQNFIEIGDTSNSSGEDSALYFTVLNDEGEKCEPERQAERFCAVTQGEQEIRYAYADYETLEGAQARAIENVDDDIYRETPVEIVDLDTREHYIVIAWNLEWRKV